MKIDWNIVAVLVSLLIVVVGWGVSVEIRMSQHASLNSIQDSIDTLNTRIQNVEKLLVPVIVDYRVRKEVEEKMAKITAPVATAVAPPTAPLPKPPDVEKHQRWAEEEIRRGQQLKK